MIWLTWRQHRFQFAAAAAVLLALAAWLAYLTLPMVEPQRLRQACARGDLSARCDELSNYAGGGSWTLDLTLTMVNLLPALIGVFWGAPLLAREYERGTHRLVWTQSVPRRRWLSAKLALPASVALLGGILQAVLLRWVTDQWVFFTWINRLSDRRLFSIVGVVPVAMWLFAFALGAAVGLVVRRTTTAMAVTLVLLATVFIGLLLVRPHYAAPQTVPTSELGGRGDRGIYHVDESWVLRQEVADGSGRVLPARELDRVCPEVPVGSGGRDHTCLEQNGLHWLAFYHPADRYWRFQLTETAILLGLTAALGTAVVIRLRRRPD